MQSDFSKQPSNPNIQQTNPNNQPQFHNQNFVQHQQYNQQTYSSFSQQDPNSNMQQNNFYSPQPSSYSNIPHQQQFPNTNIQQQQLNPNLSQHLSYSNLLQQQQPNTNLSHQSSYSNFPPQQTNSSLSMHSSYSNLPQQQQQQNQNLSQQSSYSNITQPQVQLNPTVSQQSSFSNFLQQQFVNTNLAQQKQPQPQQNQRNSQLPPTPNTTPKHFLKTQSFKVVYNGSNYIIDPISLGKASLKFRELIQPYIQDFEQMRSLHLEINNVQFTKRNMNNFLRLCQKLPTDVQNSEMKEICEIAKMFQAEEIYKTGAQFIQSSIDPSFDVPDNKYDDSNSQQKFLTIVVESNNVPINQELSVPLFSNVADNEFEFEDDAPQNQSVDLNNAVQDTNTAKVNDENKPENEINKTILGPDGKVMSSVIYQVRVENHTFKCPIFKFVSDKHIIFTAKQKFNDIFIGDGGEIHISKKHNHVARIHQNGSSISPFNTINLKDIHFDLKYVSVNSANYHSIEVSFPLNGEIINWTPKAPVFNPEKNAYFLNFHGEHHHVPIPSSKNIVLENSNGSPTFIVRKMDPNVYEIECLPVVNPLIAFCIGLSDIVGPYDDAFGGSE